MSGATRHQNPQCISWPEFGHQQNAICFCLVGGKQRGPPKCKKKKGSCYWARHHSGISPPGSPSFPNSSCEVLELWRRHQRNPTRFFEMWESLIPNSRNPWDTAARRETTIINLAGLRIDFEQCSLIRQYVSNMLI